MVRLCVCKVFFSCVSAAAVGGEGCAGDEVAAGDVAAVEKGVVGWFCGGWEGWEGVLRPPGLP